MLLDWKHGNHRLKRSIQASPGGKMGSVLIRNKSIINSDKGSKRKENIIISPPVSRNKNRK